MKPKVQDELKQHFRPEFLNRIDDIVVFHQLTQEEIITIVDLMLAKLDERLRDKDMGLELTQPAKDLLAKKGYDPVLGARPLRRTIQREIEDVLSEKILFGELRPGPDRPGRRRGRGRGADLHLPRRAEGGAARRAAGRGDRGHAGVAPAGTTTRGGPRRRSGCRPSSYLDRLPLPDRLRPGADTPPSACLLRNVANDHVGAAACGQGRDGTSRSRVISATEVTPVRAIVRSSSASRCSSTARTPSAPASARP